MFIPIETQRNKLKMETYTCTDCDNDHYVLLSDFVTMFWVHKNPYFLQRVKSGMTSNAEIKKASDKITMHEEKYTKERRKLNKLRIKRQKLASFTSTFSCGVVLENQAIQTQNSLRTLNEAQIDLAVEFLKKTEIDKADLLMKKCRKWFEFKLTRLFYKIDNIMEKNYLRCLCQRDAPWRSDATWKDVFL